MRPESTASSQQLTNFTKNPILDIVEVLHTPLKGLYFLRIRKLKNQENYLKLEINIENEYMMKITT